MLENILLLLALSLTLVVVDREENNMDREWLRANVPVTAGLFKERRTRGVAVFNVVGDCPKAVGGEFDKRPKEEFGEFDKGPEEEEVGECPTMPPTLDSLAK